MNPGKAIKALRTAKGLTARQLAELANTNQSNISRIEHGQRPRLDLEKQIAQALGVEVADFYGGGDWAIPVARGRSVPLYTVNTLGKRAETYATTDLGVSEKAFAVTVWGDSMHPEFRDGDVVLVDPAIRPQPGDYVVGAVNEMPTFRQYREREVGVFDLHPLNPVYPTVRSDRAKLRVLGAVVEHTRRFGKRT